MSAIEKNTSDFRELIEKRLSKKDLAEIERKVEIEVQAIKTMRENVWNCIVGYMNEEGINLSEVGRRLNTSSSQMNRIKKGEANLTISKMAEIFSLIKVEPKLVLTKKK